MMSWSWADGRVRARSASGRLIEHDALDERVAHGVARPAQPRRLIVADDEHLGGNAERAQDFLKPDDLAAAAEAVVLDDEEVEVALRVGLAASVRAEEDDTRRRAGRLASLCAASRISVSGIRSTPTSVRLASAAGSPAAEPRRSAPSLARRAA